MPIHFNPAATLAANRIPYALGGGRLADGPTVGPVSLMSSLILGAGSSGPELDTNSNWDFILKRNGAEWARVNGTSLLMGDVVNRANGRVQIVSHSSQAGGLAFGTHSSNETLYRYAAQVLRCGGRLTGGELQTETQLLFSDYAGGGHFSTLSVTSGALAFAHSLNTWARLRAPVATGWGLPTATLSRATFDPATVSLPQLAERVAALITDLHDSGTRHALLGV